MADMVKLGHFKRSISFIATTLCVAMISTALANPKKDKSDPDPNVDTSSLPEDGNNGHGNDPSGSDPSNPGKGKGKGKGPATGSGESTTNTNLPLGSVLELLGVSSSNDPEPDDPEAGSASAPVITPPATVTNNPFGEPTDSGGSQGNSNTPASTISLPYGSVPLIANDAASIDYLLQKLLADAKTNAEAKGQAQELTPAMKKVYEGYARKLAKTLSKLTPEQQNFVFYGVKS